MYPSMISSSDSQNISHNWDKFLQELVTVTPSCRCAQLTDQNSGWYYGVQFLSVYKLILRFTNAHYITHFHVVLWSKLKQTYFFKRCLWTNSAHRRRRICVSLCHIKSYVRGSAFCTSHNCTTTARRVFIYVVERCTPLILPLANVGITMLVFYSLITLCPERYFVSWRGVERKVNSRTLYYLEGSH